MAEWERSAVVTVWTRVRTLLVSLVWVEFLQLLVALASGLFASSEGLYLLDARHTSTQGWHTLNMAAQVPVPSESQRMPWAAGCGIGCSE